jgi:hypothetical protein
VSGATLHKVWWRLLGWGMALSMVTAARWLVPVGWGKAREGEQETLLGCGLRMHAGNMLPAPQVQGWPAVDVQQ